MRAQYRTLFLINEQGGGRIGYECNLLEHLVTFFMFGLCVYYDRCNQDDYSTKSDKKKLTGLTVSLFNIFQKAYSSAGFIKL